MEFHPVAEIFPMMSAEEFAALKADIEENGLREPIWLHDNQIIDGRNRYNACRDIGVAPEYREWNGNGSLVAFVVSLNLHRRHLSESQRAMVGARIKPMFEEEAKEKQATGRPIASYTSGRTDIKEDSEDYLSANLRQDNPDNSFKSSERAAEAVNVSPRSVESASRVVEQGAPELVQAVESGRASVSAAAEVATLPVEDQKEIVAKGEVEILKAAKEIKQARREENAKQRAEVKARQIEIPDGRYSCIVIDPPWPMEKIERDERPNQVGFEYPTMSEEELSAFPLPDFAADDCHLYLWTTHRFLPMALRLAEHWGFKYQCLMTWVKNVGFTPFSWMYSTEHVLFCRKGSLQLEKLGMRLDFNAKVREHSRKPDEFYDLVRQASPGPRIDVFSREDRDGFDQWGKEVEKFKEAAI